MKKEKEINGVYDKDLPKLLEGLGLKDDFYNGNIRCAFSDEVVTMDNLLSIFSDGKEIKFACDNDIARMNLSELSRKKDE